MTSESILVRKPRLDFSQPIERFYLHDNPIKTHIFNALNLLFPDGERFFVKAVHDHASQIDDPQLLRDIRAFSGQEGQHANQHERFFATLHEQGYRVGGFLSRFHGLVRFSRYLPRSLRLSMTAGAEHYTASLATQVFESDILHVCDPTMRKLIEWHALEEIEHKHVAYDVFARSYPRGYLLRILGFLLASCLIVGLALVGLRMLLVQDGRAGRLSRRELAAARKTLGDERTLRFRRSVRRMLVRYFVPGFHPNQQDDRALLQQVRPRVSQALASE